MLEEAVVAKRHFGSVRRRASGRWQATYFRDGKILSVGVFDHKADAFAKLAEIEVDLRRGTWTDPRSGRVRVSDYAEQWLSHRPDLAVRTRELYEYLLAKYIAPDLGHHFLLTLSSSAIRQWYADLAAHHPSTAAKSYRLLSTIMKTAVVDGLIAMNPCRVVGASVEHPAERPTATVAEVEHLAHSMPEHLSIVVVLAAWCQLRRGEILGLRRRDVDVEALRLHIEQSRTFLRDGSSLVKAPKTRAGRRVVAVSPSVMKDLAEHLHRFVGDDPDSVVVVNLRSEPVSAMALQRAWSRARESIGRPELHLHDLRHTGLTLAAATGATTAELMHRAGHASPEAALRYQHATQDRDQLLADTLDVLRVRRVQSS